MDYQNPQTDKLVKGVAKRPGGPSRKPDLLMVKKTQAMKQSLRIMPKGLEPSSTCLSEELAYLLADILVKDFQAYNL